MTVNSRTIAASSLVLYLASGGIGHAEQAASGIKVSDHPPSQANQEGVLARARPIVNPNAIADMSGARPDPNAERHAPGALGMDGRVDLRERDFGSFGVPYTTTRVQEGARSVEADDVNRLSTTYPYRAIGKVTFELDGASTFCSASVIRRGLVLTAAHCIFEDTSYTFLPGHYNGEGTTDETMAPYGMWTPFRSVVGMTFDGEDSCVSTLENDLAVLAIGPNEDGAFIGDVTGYLGYGWNNYSFTSSENTGNVTTGAVSTLGYPGLIDGGNIMQRTDGPTYPVVLSADNEFNLCGEDVKVLQQGSNLTGGSSGGPWVVNFSGVNADLSLPDPEIPPEFEPSVGEAPIMAVVGVTSFGSFDPNDPKDNFSSQLGQNAKFPDEDYGGYGAGNIGALVEEICSTEAPEGGTLASAGYCDGAD